MEMIESNEEKEITPASPEADATEIGIYLNDNTPNSKEYLNSLGVETINGNKPETNIDLQLEPKGQECKLSLVLPAKNEAERISTTLESLGAQTATENGLDTFEIILVVNDTTDETAEKAQEKVNEINKALEEAGRRDRLKMHTVTVDFKDSEGGVGKASKLGMDIALSRETPYIARYGADTKFDPEWISGIIKTFERTGAGAVRGETTTDIEDRASLSEDEQRLMDQYFQEYSGPAMYLQRLKIANQSGEDVDKAVIGGAAAVTREAYARAQGMPTDKTGEDMKFGRNLREAGVRIVRAKDLGVKVDSYTSGRADGRAEGGAADFISDLKQAVETGKELLVPDPENTTKNIPLSEAIGKFKEMTELKPYFEKEDERRIAEITTALNDYFVATNSLELSGEQIYNHFKEIVNNSQSKQYLEKIRDVDIIRINDVEKVARDLVANLDR